MVILVKCPICKSNLKLPKKPKFYFRHCGYATEIENNIIYDNTGKITPNLPKREVLITDGERKQDGNSEKDNFEITD